MCVHICTSVLGQTDVFHPLKIKSNVHASMPLSLAGLCMCVLESTDVCIFEDVEKPGKCACVRVCVFVYMDVSPDVCISTGK